MVPEIKILTVTTLFPNSENPQNGIFVLTRLRELLKDHPGVSAKVVAPIPWFPFASPKFGRYAKYSRVSERETLDGIDVLHPRYLVIPKVGMLFTPFFLFISILGACRSLQKEGYQFKLIDGHYFYPDGVAIALAALALNLPYILTARGTDLNVIAQMHLPGRMIRWSSDRAFHLITVCNALRDTLCNLGVRDPEKRITVLRNGVDLEKFKPPKDRGQLRSQLGFNRCTLLSVGNLKSMKGHHLVIEALSHLPALQLVIVGDGDQLEQLKSLARKLGVADRVEFTGSISQTSLTAYYGASDLLVLASSREGWANVLLESMACGTPVVATDVGGTPEIIDCERSGLLMERSAAGIAEAVRLALKRNFDREQVRAYAENFDWSTTSLGQVEVFRRAIR